MAVRIVRLGSPRKAGEGPRLGAVRRPPRGVKARDYSRLNYFDAWLPELSPEPAALKRFLSRPREEGWGRFSREYRRRMSSPDSRRLLKLLAVLSKGADFSVGCYCEEESFCHRSLLRELLKEEGAKTA
jgi:uncharacterized protein YeaO (DUF488 family)